MKWHFTITETSNGAYKCIAKRDTGNIVSIQCGEDEIYRVFQQAYEIEVELGTLPSKALFAIVSSAKQNCGSEYNDTEFGSWIVKSHDNKWSFVYDGKDFYLMIYESSEMPKWQGIVRKNEDVPYFIFQFLV